MKKRIKIFIFMFTLILAVVFISCKSDPLKKYEKMLDANSSIIKLEVWTYYNNLQAKAFDEFVDEFNSTVGQKRNIFVEHHSYNKINDLINAVKNAAEGVAAARDFPDIFQSYSNDLMDLDFKHNIIASYDNYFSQNELDEFIPGLLDEGRYDKDQSLKLIPFAKSNEMLMVNTTDFNKFANEFKDKNYTLEDFKTYEKLVPMAQDYYEATGKGLYGRDALANLVYLGAESLNKPLFDIDPESKRATITFDEGYFRKLYDSHYVTFVKNYFATNSSYHTDDIKTGTVAACVGSTAGVKYFPSEVFTSNTESYPIEGTFLAPTIFEGAKNLIVSQGASFAIKKSTELREYASSVFIKYLINSKNNTRLALLLGCYLPVKKELLKIDTIRTEFIKLKKEEFPTLSETEILDKQENKMELQALTQMIENLKNYTSYSPQPFINSYKVRNILDKCLEGSVDNLVTAKDLVALIKQDIENGISKDTAINNHLNGNFDRWFSDLIKIVDEIVKE